MQRYTIVLFFLIMLVWSCVEPVDFDANEPQDLLVVDGSVSAGANSHTIRLSRTGPLDKRVFDPEKGASIMLFEENGNSATYTELEDGYYELSNANLAGIAGRSYYIEIELADGKKYRSGSEQIPVNVELDSVTFELDYEEFANDAGNVIRRNFVKAFANLTVPSVSVGPYLRWEVDETYLVSEKKCSPLDNAKNCYIRTPNINKKVSLFSGDNFTPGAVYQQEVAKRKIDFAFGERYSFSVYQIAQTKAALEYWTKIDQVVSLEGSIFDVAPAPIQGNIYNIDDPDEQVLGYFSAIARDTAHLFVNRFDVAPLLPVSPYCGPPEQAWWLSPSECCNCLNLLYSSFDRPDFW